MLKLVGTNVFLLLIAVNLASEGAYAAPIPGFSMPKLGGAAKAPTPSPPKTTNANGEPISFWDADSVLDMPVKSSSDTASKAMKGGTIVAVTGGIVGGGVAAGVSASENPGLGYDYAG